MTVTGSHCHIFRLRTWFTCSSDLIAAHILFILHFGKQILKIKVLLISAIVSLLLGLLLLTKITLFLLQHLME